MALRDPAAARGALVPLHADPRIMAAGLYDNQGKLFAAYPAKAPAGSFPPAPGPAGYHFEAGHLIIFQPVGEGHERFGMLYLKSGHYPLTLRLRLFGGGVLLVFGGSLAVALLIANVLQRRVTEPVLALAEMAKVVSERGDYSVRATKSSQDEIGVLTDAFNRMLSRIEEQTDTLSRNEKVLSFLAAIVQSSESAIVGKDLEGTVLSWNAGAERMFGYTAQEMIGQPITRLQAPDRPEAHPRRGQAGPDPPLRDGAAAQRWPPGQPVAGCIARQKPERRDDWHFVHRTRYHRAEACGLRIAGEPGGIIRHH
jgi:PAS domain-containing protein